MTVSTLATAGLVQAAITYSIPSTIAADCSVDVTAVLTSWVATVPDYSVLSLPPNSCYRIDGMLELDGRNGLDFEGHGATFRAGTQGNASRDQWRFVGGSHITMRNMTLVGADSAGGTSTAFVPALQWQHGVDLLGVAGAEVSGLTIDNVYGDCIYVGLGNDGVSWSSDVYAHDNTCQRNGRQGMSVTAGRAVTFDHNTLAQGGLVGVDIEPNGGVTGAQDIHVTNNHFGTNTQQFIDVSGGSGGGSVGGITITGNTVSGNSLATYLAPPSGERWSNLNFSNNTSNTPVNPASAATVSIAQFDGVTVTNNYQPGGAPGQVFLSAIATCNITVSGNQFPGGGGQASVAPYDCGGGSPNCTTYTSASTGSHQVCGGIRDRYLALGGPSGFLGYPTTDETGTPDGVGRFNHFANNGSIYWTPATGAWSIHGAIRSKWASMGWEQSVLGYPVTDETGTPDGVGRFNHFANNGSIYWTPSTGAWSIHGAILAKYQALGGPSSVLGYPVTDETGTPGGVGRFNHFANSGSIYWTPSTGAWSIHGMIRDKWASMGWERSCLGYPISDEFGISGGRQSNLQGGEITYSWGSPQANSSC
jgi:hypothetical protein